MNQRSFSNQLATVCLLVVIMIAGFFLLDRASASTGMFVPITSASLSRSDNFGYTFRDSNEPDEPEYAWEEINDSGGLAYIPMAGDNSLALIDTYLHETIDTIDVSQFGCEYPRRAKLTPDGQELYVMCEASDNIIILESTNFSLVATIDRPDTCGADITFIRQGAYALASTGDCGLYQIDVIDTQTHTITQSIPISGYSVRSIAAHPYLPLAYAAGARYSTGSVLVIDTNTFSVKTAIHYGQDMFDVHPSPDGQWVYANNYSYYGLVKIDVSSNKIVDTLPGHGTYGMEISPDGSRIYASSEWDIAVIDTASMEYITTIEVGPNTYENALTCDGHELYVAREYAMSIPVIDTEIYSITYDIPITGMSNGYGITICPQYVAEGVFLHPQSQSEFADEGGTITYTLQLVNMTGDTDSFDLEVLPGNTWTTALSSDLIGPIEYGESITFTTWVEVSPNAQPADIDTATIKASSVISPSITDTANLSTIVTSEELAYISIYDTNSVDVIDTILHTAIDTIDLTQYGCEYPKRTRISLDGGELYVICGNFDGLIIVLDTTDLSLVTTITKPNACTLDVTFVQSGAYALVSSKSCWFGSLPIDVIDTTTYSVIQSISTSDYKLNSIAAHPYLPLAYAVGTKSNTGGILVIDTTTFTVQTIIPYGDNLWDVQTSPDGIWIYVSESLGQGIAKIEVSTHIIMDTLPGYGRMGLSISPDGTTIYASEGSNNLLSVIDTSTMDLITTIDVGVTTYESGLACGGNELYVSRSATTIPVFDTHNYNLIYDIPISGFSSGYGPTICPQYQESVILIPSEQSKEGGHGEPVVYQERLVNASMTTDTFNLEILDYLWETQLSTSQIGPLASGESADFTVTVTVPLDAPWYDIDHTAIRATGITSPSMTSEAQLITTAYAPAIINVDPDSLESVLYVGEVVTQAMTISNGDGVTLTFEISEDFPRDSSLLMLPLDEAEGSSIFYDESGSDHHGTCVYPTCPAAGIAGQIGTAVSFDGIDDGIGVGNWFNLQSFTIAMWVKPGSWQVEMADIIDNNHDGSRSWRVQQMGLGYPPNNYHFGYNTPEILVFDLIPDIWQHLVITLDESNFVSSVYIDGNLVNTAQGEYPINYDGTESLQLGSWAAGARYWNGSLDEVRVFERALSAEEVQQLYQIESGADIPWLNFNPVAGMVQTNGSDPVAVTFDATGVQPGVYKLSLSIGSNDPVDPFVQVPVTMTVFTVPPVIITISGLSEGRVETSYTFTATIEPVSTTLPLSYTWQADGQLPITHTVGLTDTVSFDWEIPGTYAITVTASNLAGEVSDSHLITLTMPIYDTYLPLVIKSDGAPLGSTRTPLRQEGLALIGLVVVGIMERWKRRS